MFMVMMFSSGGRIVPGDDGSLLLVFACWPIVLKMFQSDPPFPIPPIQALVARKETSKWPISVYPINFYEDYISAHSYPNTRV